MRPLTWESVFQQVWAPTWRSRAASQSEALRGLTAGRIAEALRSGELRQKIKNPPNTWPTNHERAQMAEGAAVCAFALALLADGWTFHIMPGDSFCEKNGHRLEPFKVVPQLAKGEITAEQWVELCAQTGISELSLSEGISSGAAGGQS